MAIINYMLRVSNFYSSVKNVYTITCCSVVPLKKYITKLTLFWFIFLLKSKESGSDINRSRLKNIFSKL